MTHRMNLQTIIVHVANGTPKHFHTSQRPIMEMFHVSMINSSLNYDVQVMKADTNCAF